MKSQDRLFDYKDGLFLRGISMFAFGLVALWHPGDGIEAMITPFGILVLMNGLATALVGRFFFSAGSVLRVLSVRHGVLDVLLGSASIFTGILDMAVFPQLLTLWLITTGVFYCFFSLRFIPRLVHPQLISLGALHILLGGLYYINHSMEVWSILHPVALMAILLGAFTYYTLNRIRRTERKRFPLSTDSLSSDPFDSTELYQSSRR